MRAAIIRSFVILSIIGAITGTAFAARQNAVIDGGASGFETPVLRLIPLPEGVGEAAVQLGGETDPRLEVISLAPGVMRGMRVQPVVIRRSAEAMANAAGEGEAEQPAPAAAVLEIEYTGVAQRGSPESPTEFRNAADPADVPRTHLYGRGFFRAISSWMTDPGDGSGSLASRLEEMKDGSYLIVTSPAFEAGVQPLAQWKREKGFHVNVVTTAAIGESRDMIKAYISRQYQEAAVPPEYVLLVGDVEFVPTFDYQSVPSDHPYTLLEGDDFFPELQVGRLSVSTVAELQTVVAKVLRHEKNPYRADESWITRGLTVATNSNAPTCVDTERWVANRMREMGFDEVVEAMYTGRPPYPPETQIADAINQGVSLVSYRGWAQAENGWGWRVPFVSDNVRVLNNTHTQPVVMSFVCQTGKYDVPACFGEYWLRIGTPEAPRGAVAFIGNGEHWSHTRFNDAMAIGTFGSMRYEGLRRLGDVLLAAKMHLLTTFPSEIYDADGGRAESVEYYFYVYTLLGDPEMEIMTGLPRPVSFVTPASVAAGTNLLSLAVADSATLAPLVGARVGIVQGTTTLGCAYTGADGTAHVEFAGVMPGDPLTVTVTGTGLAAGQRQIVVDGSAAALTFDGLTVVDGGSGDSSGNGDAVANPGERLELRVQVRNRGGGPVNDGRLSLASLDGIDIITGEATLPPVQPGAVATGTPAFVIDVPATAADAQILRFLLTARGAGETQVSSIQVPVRAPELLIENPSIGGDGIIEAGETAELLLTLRNDGSIGAAGITATLRCVSGGEAVVIDSTASFGDLAPGEQGGHETPFTLRVDEGAVAGSAVNLLLLLQTASGVRTAASFALPVGAADITAPTGPDAYGYWAYDNTDTDYPAGAPLYDWFEISTVFGGPGTKVTLPTGEGGSRILELPFDFVYYGEAFDSVRVNDNGWIAFELDDSYDFYNWSLPSAYGPGGRVAPMWDNFVFTKEGREVGVDGVYFYHDTAGHRYIVEWSRVTNRDIAATTEEDPVLYTDLHTFQLLLYDPAYLSGPTGDGVIQFQYKQVINQDARRMYCTVGIESPDKADGMQYSYCNLGPATAAPISPGLAIRLTTQAPTYLPFSLARAEAWGGPGGVQLLWSPADDRPRSGYAVYRSIAGGPFRRITTEALASDSRSYADGSAEAREAFASGTEVLYKIGSTDPVGRETVIGPIAAGSAGSDPALTPVRLVAGSPMSGAGWIEYTAPSASKARLTIHDLSGREVRQLSGVQVEGASSRVYWDGRDGDGRAVSGGVYFVRLRAGDQAQERKIVLLR